jgi:hypothetical protein
MLDSSGGNSTIPLTDAAVIRQNKPEAATSKSQNKNSSLSSERQYLRKEASPKHRAPQSAATKPVNVKPPRFSISPE